MSDSSLYDVLRRLASLEIDSKKAAAQNVAVILPRALTPRLDFGDLLNKKLRRQPKRHQKVSPQAQVLRNLKRPPLFL